MGAQIRWVIHRGHLIPVLKTRNNRQLAREVSYVVFVRLPRQFSLSDFRGQFSNQEEYGFAVNYLRKLQAYGLVEREGDSFRVAYEYPDLGRVVESVMRLERQLARLEKKLSTFEVNVNESRGSR